MQVRVRDSGTAVAFGGPGNYISPVFGLADELGEIVFFAHKKTGEIIILNIDLNGNEKRNQTFSIGQSIDIQDIAVVPGEGYFVTGILTNQEGLNKNVLTIIKILDTSTGSVVPLKNSYYLTVIS